MDAFELSVTIKRPIEEALTVMADLENDVKWHSAFVEVRNTAGGPNGVGARFLVFEGLAGRRAGRGTVYEVTEYEPNRIAAWKPTFCEHLILPVNGRNLCQQKMTQPSK